MLFGYVYVPTFQCLNYTSFLHENWYTPYVTGGHPSHVFSVTIWHTHKQMKSECQ